MAAALQLATNENALIPIRRVESLVKVAVRERYAEPRLIAASDDGRPPRAAPFTVSRGARSTAAAVPCYLEYPHLRA
jgi:hypothetical protein